MRPLARWRPVWTVARNPESKHVIVENEEQRLSVNLFAVCESFEKIKSFTLKDFKRIATFLCG